MSTPKFIGNHSVSGSRGHNIVEGVGVAGWPQQSGGGSMTGKAGEIGYIPLGGIMPASGLNQGVFLQSEVAVDIEYTLCNPALATNPDPAVQAAVLWADLQSLTAGALVRATPLVFACMKVTFNGDGTLYIGAL